MKHKVAYFKNLRLILLSIGMLGFACCNNQSERKTLVFKDYPDIKLGVSTQNFLKALPFNVEGLTQVMEYASKEGFSFVEIRDQFVDLSLDDCKKLSAVAQKNKLEVIYVFNKNLLDPTFPVFFKRALDNALAFEGPGILRALASKTEFDADSTKKGWTNEEFSKLVRISDSCASIGKSKNIRLVYENSNEAFFGDNLSFFGLTDLINKSANTGLQLDVANLFRNTSRVKNDPEKILNYLSSNAGGWVETHFKSVQGGEAQTTLTENPLPFEEIVELMGRRHVNYAAIELTTVSDRTQCFENHKKSIQFLKDNGILKE